MKALVTGATGLVGSHLVQALLRAGYEVRVLVRPSSPFDNIAGLPVETAIGDIREFGDHLVAACAGCDLVFHAAAYFAYSGHSASELSSTAIDGTRNVLAACGHAGVRRAVITSSSVAFGYGERSDCLLDESATVAVEDDVPYVAAKSSQHLAALSLADTLKTEIVLGCPTIVLGKSERPLGPSNGVIASYLADPFHCTFPGGCNIVSAEDVADGHVVIGEKGKPGESYLLGSTNLTWRELHSQISRLVGLPEPRIELNHTLAYLAASFDEMRSYLASANALSTRTQAAMIGRYYWYSSERAHALGYAPRPGSTALLETVSWLVASRHVDRETRRRLRLSSEVFEYRRRTSGKDK
jgi:dihydroflavonol-4-reductase